MQSAADEWAMVEFSAARLGDTRLTKRLVALAAELAKKPSGVVARSVVEPAAREAAYQLLENDKVQGEKVSAAAFEATAARCRGRPFAWVPVDASSVSITDPLRERGTGPVGNQNRGGRGFQLMSALAVDPEGVPLGLCGQQWWARDEDRKTRPKSERDGRDTSEKETRRFLDTVAQARRTLEGTGCRPWFQIDRGGDAWPVLLDAQDAESWLTVRACHNRRLERGQTAKRQTYLWPVVRATRPVGQYSIEVAGGPARRARTAVMVVRTREVSLDLETIPRRTHAVARVWAVHAREIRVRPGEARLEWMLLTTFPATSFEDACTVVRGYTQRWRIEEFHKALKSGACNVEDTQLRSGRGIHVLTAILSSVATRLLRMTYLSRRSPDLPAAEEFSLDELRAAAALTRRRKPRTSKGISLSTAVTWIAEAGGYTGRSSGGPPGFVVLGRGLYRVLTVVEATEVPKKDRRNSKIPTCGQG